MGSCSSTPTTTTTTTTTNNQQLPLLQPDHALITSMTSSPTPNNNNNQPPPPPPPLTTSPNNNISIFLSMGFTPIDSTNYAISLEQAGCDSIEKLLTLTMDDLNVLNIKKSLHVRKIMQYIKTQPHHSTQPTTTITAKKTWEAPLSQQIRSSSISAIISTSTTYNKSPIYSICTISSFIISVGVDGLFHIWNSQLESVESISHSLQQPIINRVTSFENFLVIGTNDGLLSLYKLKRTASAAATHHQSSILEKITEYTFTSKKIWALSMFMNPNDQISSSSSSSTNYYILVGLHDGTMALLVTSTSTATTTTTPPSPSPPLTIKCNRKLHSERILCLTKTTSMQDIKFPNHTTPTTEANNHHQPSILFASGSVDLTILLFYIDFILNDFVLLYVLKGHTGWVRSIEFTTDGLISGCEDGILKMWTFKSLTSDDEPSLLHPHLIKEATITKDVIQSISISFDGSVLAIGTSTGKVLLWDLPELQPIIITGNSDEFVVSSSTIRSVCWLPDKPMLVAGGNDKILRGWVYGGPPPPPTTTITTSNIKSKGS